MTSARQYSFKVGSIDCTVLLDGVTALGKDGILKRFPDVGEADCRQAYADTGLSLDAADTTFNILAAKIGQETILVDSGEGAKPHGGHLLESMNLAGIKPEDVTRVVITHTHGDHVLGLLSEDGRPVFPNATYILSKEEMTFWQRRLEGAAADQRPIVGMMEGKGLSLIEMDARILPGLQAVPIPGHTPGQIALLIESEGEALIHMADLLHTPMQFAHPDWSPTFDANTAVAAATRRQTLRRAADGNLQALFYHLPFPGLGRIRPANTEFNWEALKVPTPA